MSTVNAALLKCRRALPYCRAPLAAALLCLFSFTAFWVAQRLSGVSMIDLMVYRAEGAAVRTGHDLYALRVTHASLPATYPPFAAMLFTPLTLLDVAHMRTLATAANLALLVAVVRLSLRLIGPRPPLPPAPAPLPSTRTARMPRATLTLPAAALAVWCEPVWTTLRYGQVNLALTALVLWDLTRRPGRPGYRWAGAGIGVAAGIKLTPALFAVALALHGLVRSRTGMRESGAEAGAGDGVLRRLLNAWNPWLRQAGTAAAVFAGTVLLGWAVLPRDSRSYWGGAVLRSDRAGPADITDDQSLRGVVARLLHTAHPGLPWLVPAALVAVAGLGAAVAAMAAGPRRLPYAHAWSALACACTGLLVSPVSWSHHWVWCVPLVLLLCAEASRRHRPGSASGPGSGFGSGFRSRSGTVRGRQGEGRGGVRWWAVAGAGALVFCSYALWWVPHGSTGPQRPELGQDPGQMALSAVYPAAGLAFLVLTAAVSVRALRGPLPGPSVVRQERRVRQEQETRETRKGREGREVRREGQRRGGEPELPDAAAGGGAGGGRGPRDDGRAQADTSRDPESGQAVAKE